jgi:hypothetical protein
VLGAAIALAAVVPATARAACAVGPTLRERIAHPALFGRYDVAFIGTALEVRPSVRSDLGRDTTEAVFTPVVLDVEAVLHGVVPARVTVMDVGGRLPGSNIGVGGEGTVGFREGRRYVFVGMSDPDGTYVTDECAGTSPIEGSGKELIRLAGGPEATRPAAGGGGSSRLTLILSFLAGAGLSAGLLLARRNARRKPGRG